MQVHLRKTVFYCCWFTLEINLAPVMHKYGRGGVIKKRNSFFTKIVTSGRWPTWRTIFLFNTFISLLDLHTGRSVTGNDSTRCCVNTADLLMMSTFCSKHVEDWNKRIVYKNCASSWWPTRSYIEMHGQQNIKIIPKLYLPTSFKGNLFAEAMKVAHSRNTFVIPMAYTNPELFSWNCEVYVTFMSSAQNGFHYPS